MHDLIRERFTKVNSLGPGFKFQLCNSFFKNFDQLQKKIQVTHCSGLMFFSQDVLRASSAVILLSGSNSNILSNKSRADAGMKMNSSLIRLLYSFFGFKAWKRGNLITEGQTAGVGVPHSFEIISSCIISALA